METCKHTKTFENLQIFQLKNEILLKIKGGDQDPPPNWAVANGIIGNNNGSPDDPPDPVKKPGGSGPK